MKFGVALTGDPPLDGQVDLARRAEASGFDHVWVWDNHIVKQECAALMTLVGSRTDRVAVGTCVTNPVTRHPTVIASLFATLANLVGAERVTCGIGRGGSALRVRDAKPATVAELETAVAVIRALLRGEEAEIEGSTVRLEWATGGAVPVLVSASGPKALRLAGRVGDGVILTVADPVFVEWCLEHVRAGLEEAGRVGEGYRVQVAVPAFLSEDRAEAIEQTRWFPAFLGNHIADVLREHPAEKGNEELWRYVENRPAYDYKGHARPGGNPNDFVPDEVVERFTLAGSAEHTIERIRGLEALGVTEINVYLSARDAQRVVDSYGSEVLPAFSP